MVLVGRLKEGDHLEYLDVNKVEMDLQEVEWGGMDWIDLAQDRDIGRAILNEIINLRVP
jgi:hypothetical protein